MIVLCSGIIATLAVGVGGIIYSVLEKNGGDEPVDPNVLPKSVYIIENNVLMGFTKEFLANPTAYDMCDTMQIPANVTSINGFAFYDDTEYKTTIPSFITKLTFADGSNCSSIGNDTFRSSSLTSVKLPSALITIQDSAFEECSTLTSVDFSNAIKLTSIGEDAFTACIKLSSANLSNCAILDSINGFAFGNCSTLSSVTLPSSLKIIGAQAFTYCDQLTSVNFSECTGLTKIKNSAFSHCPLLSTSVDLENAINLTSIGQQAFRFCNSLTSISLPSSLTSLSYNTFSDCPNLNSITWDAWDGNTSLVNSSFLRVSSKGTVVVTSSSEYDGVDLLQYLVNNGGLPESWLPDPELPDDVYIIENNVLKGFTAGFLANPSAYRLSDTMEIPANVTSIDDGAFYKNWESTIPSFITKLTFAEGSVCSTIGGYAFYKCQSLTSVIFPSSFTEITGQYAFDSCTSLASVDLSNCNNLTAIYTHAFSGCTLLSDVKLPNNLKTIHSFVFTDCTSLKTINLPQSLTSLDDYSFMRTGLISADLSNCVNLTSIGSYSFSENQSLTSVILPRKLNYIGGFAFSENPLLNYIAWDIPSSFAVTINSRWCFNENATTGKVESLNSSVSSQNLLDWLKEKCSFINDNDWTAKS